MGFPSLSPFSLWPLMRSLPSFIAVFLSIEGTLALHYSSANILIPAIQLFR